MSKILQIRGLNAPTSKVFLAHYNSFFFTENLGNIIPFLLKIIFLPMQLFWVQTAVDCHLGSAPFACASIVQPLFVGPPTVQCTCQPQSMESTIHLLVQNFTYKGRRKGRGSGTIFATSVVFAKQIKQLIDEDVFIICNQKFSFVPLWNPKIQ